MSGSFYAGIDVGSGSVKATLQRSDGAVMAMGAADYETCYPQPGFVEQDVDDWYSAACAAVREALKRSEIAPADVAGIGLSGTSHVPCLLDENRRPVRCGILWNDQRSGEQVRRLSESHGNLIERSAMNTVNCTWSLPQMLWVRENEPELFKRVRFVLFSKDYLTYRLTGRLVADRSTACSSLLVAAATVSWDPELLQLVGLPESAYPEIRASAEVVGALTSQAAQDLGLAPGVKVVAGMLDSAAELVGVGAVDPTVGVIRLGTAGGVMIICDEPQLRKGCLLYPHPAGEYWYHQAGTNSATTSLQWIRGVLGLEGAEWSYERLEHMANEAASGAAGLLFHPYLLGERAPYWSDTIRGGFHGITLSHGRPEFLRAVLEGVAYSLRDCTGLLDLERVTQLRICGGGAKSRIWCQIIADVLGLPVDRMDVADASALGAAMIALAGCERRDPAQTAVSALKSADRIEPDAARHRLYSEQYQRYREVAAQYLRSFEPDD